MDEKLLTLFLHAISLNESSGGQNLNHPVIESGIHKGHAAKGEYGIMPNTYNEILKRYPKLKNKVKIVDGEHPALTNQQLVAEKLAKHLYEKTGGDLDKMATSWHHGHNLHKTNPEKLNRLSQDSEYVNRFRKHKEISKEKLNKLERLLEENK